LLRLRRTRLSPPPSIKPAPPGPARPLATQTQNHHPASAPPPGTSSAPAPPLSTPDEGDTMSSFARPTRRTVTGLGAAAALGLLAACGRPDETESGPAAPAEPIAEGAATGSLTVWAMGAEGEKLPELLKGFQEQNPDVTVEVTPVPWDSAHDKFTSAIAAGTAPDVAQVGSTWMAEFVGLNALESTPEEVATDDYFPGALEAVTVDGTVYGVPWYVETRVVYYRKDLAEKAGITEPPTD